MAEQNIAGIAKRGIGQQVDIKTLKVARVEKAQLRSLSQLASVPQTFPWIRSARRTVNQSDAIEIIRHSRELAAHSGQGKEECMITHAHENAIEAPRVDNLFSANGNNSLNLVSPARGALQGPPLLGRSSGIKPFALRYRSSVRTVPAPAG